MKRFIVSGLLALASASAAAADVRTLSGFTAIDAEDRLTVTVSVGDRHAVEVTGSDADRVRTRVDGRTLYIEDARRPWFGRSPRLDAHVQVTAPAVDALSAARGAQLTADLADHPCTDLIVGASMGGSVNVAGARCNTVSSSASMGGDLRIAGACHRHDVSASMGAYVRSDDLQCETVDASASMGGDIRAFASRSYDATASMGGSINVAGGAGGRDISTSMGGSVDTR